MSRKNKMKKVISGFVCAVLAMGSISTFAAYPTPVQEEDGSYTYHYTLPDATWEPDADMGGYVSKVQNVGSDGQFKDKWLNGVTYIEEYSNAAKRFTVGGKHFILLDADEEGNYFVIADDLYGEKSFAVNISRPSDAWNELFYNGTWKYDPTNESNIAYWLNHDFLENGNKGNNLPEAIKKKLVEKADWGLEGGTKIEDQYFYNTVFQAAQAKYTAVAPYVVTQKVSLLSAVELATYWRDISPLVYGVEPYAQGKEWNYNVWWLRSVDNKPITSDTGLQAMYVTAADGKRMGSNMYNNLGVRPCFWLNKDFFGTVALDVLDGTATDVVKEVKKASVTDLLELYTPEQLQAIGISTDVSNAAQNVYVEGEAVAGNTVTARYTTAYPDAAVEWLHADAEDGIYETAAQGDTLELKNEHAGYMKLKISAGADAAPAYSPVFPVTKLDSFAGTSSVVFDAAWADRSEADSFVIDTDKEMKDWVVLDKVYGADGKAQLFIYTNTMSNASLPWDGNASDNNTASQKYDIAVEGSVAQRLAVNGISAGNPVLNIDTAMFQYAKPHNWRTEAGLSDVIPDDYFVKDTKAAALSVWEYKKYGSKIWVQGGKNPTHLRTPATMRDASSVNQRTATLSLSGAKAPKLEGNGSLKSWHIAVRPALYLGIDYFKQGRINTAETAEDAKIYDILKTYYTKGELAENNSGADDKLLSAEEIPAANSLNIHGSLVVGATVEADYTYVPAQTNGTADSGTTYQWYAMGASGVYEPIAGAVNKTFTLTASEMGRKLLVEVIPADANGTQGLAAVAYTNEVVQTQTAPQGETAQITITATENNAATAQFDITAEKEGSYAAIVAIYDENNTMLACKTEAISVSSGENTATVTVTADSTMGTTCKAMLWSSLDQIRPVCEAVEGDLKK